MNWQAFSYIILLAAMIGSVTVGSSFCLGQFDSITYNSLRLLLAALAYWAFYLFGIQGKKVPRGRKFWLQCGVTGILGSGLTVILIVSSLQYLSSGVMATLVTIFPVVVVVLAHFFLPDEKLNPRKIVGVLLALSGAILMVALGETGLKGVEKANPIGYIMIFCAASIAGFVTIYMRREMMEYDAFEVVSIRLTWAAIAAVPTAWLIEGFDLSRVTPLGWGIFIYASFVLFAGFLLGFYILQRFGATLSAMPDYIAPIFAALGGALLLNEQITLGMVTGMVLILLGVFLINSKGRRLHSRTM